MWTYSKSKNRTHDNLFSDTHLSRSLTNDATGHDYEGREGSEEKLGVLRGENAKGLDGDVRAISVCRCMVEIEVKMIGQMIMIDFYLRIQFKYIKMNYKSNPFNANQNFISSHQFNLSCTSTHPRKAPVSIKSWMRTTKRAASF